MLACCEEISTMECLACHSLAAFSSPSHLSLVASVQVCPPSATYSSVKLWSQNSRTLGSCSYFRSRRATRFWTCSSSRQLSTTLSFNSSPTVVIRGSSPSQTENVPSPPANVAGKVSRTENLSAKERRKLRNERREEAKASQEHSWREAVEERLLQKKKKIKGWDEDADINRCSSKGIQWWMLHTTRKYEFQVAENLSIVFPENFPGREFEVLVPTVPVRTKLKDGSASLSRKKLYEGIVLLRCLLDRDVYLMVKKVPRAYEFFGNLAGFSLQPIVMPAPVSNFNMDNLFQKIRKEEEEYEKFKKQCRKEVEEQAREKQRTDEKQQQTGLQEGRLRSKGLVLEVGASVRLLSGPFSEFTGKVVELLPEIKKIKAVVTVFGNDTQIELDVEDVVVEAATVD